MVPCIRPSMFVINTVYDSIKKQINVTVKQDQDLSKTPLYRIPFSIDIYKNGKAERQNVILEQQNQTFSFAGTEAPDLVNADAEKCIPAEKTENKTLPQYIFQYRHAPLFLDKYEALNVIKTHKEDQSARAVMIQALKDKNSLLRRWALDFVYELNEEERKSVYSRVSEMALKDEKSLVRADAVRVLTAVYSSYNNAEIFQKAKKDKAPSVIKALGFNAEGR